MRGEQQTNFPVVRISSSSSSHTTHTALPLMSQPPHIPLISGDDIAQMRQQCEALYQEVVSREVSKLQDDQIREQVTKERDAAQAQVAHMQAAVRQRDEEIQRLTSSHKLELDQTRFHMNQQIEQKSAELAAVTAERNQLHRDLESHLMQQQGSDRILRLEQDGANVTTALKHVQEQADKLSADIEYNFKMMAAAKQIINRLKADAAVGQKKREELNQQIAALKQQFVQFTTGKVQSCDTAGIRVENEMLRAEQKRVSGIYHVS